MWGLHCQGDTNKRWKRAESGPLLRPALPPHPSHQEQLLPLGAGPRHWDPMTQPLRRLGPHRPSLTSAKAAESRMWERNSCVGDSVWVTLEGDVLGNILFQDQRDPGGHLARSPSTMGRCPTVGPQTSSTGASHCRGLPEPTHHPDKGHLSRSWPLGPWPCRKLCCLPAPPKLGGACLPLYPSSPQNSSPEAAPHPDTEAVGRASKGPLTPPWGGACPTLGPKDPLVQAGPPTATPGSSPLLPGVLCGRPRGTPASPAAGSHPGLASNPQPAPPPQLIRVKPSSHRKPDRPLQ